LEEIIIAFTHVTFMCTSSYYVHSILVTTVFQVNLDQLIPSRVLFHHVPEKNLWGLEERGLQRTDVLAAT